MLSRPLFAMIALTMATGAVHAEAAKAPREKPIKRSYQVTAFPPDPSYGLGVRQGTCNQFLAAAQNNTPFKVPFPGVLTVDLTGFSGDWDLALYDTNGKVVTKSSQGLTDPVDRPEHLVAALTQVGSTYNIRACNFLGGPNATVSYVFRPAA